ncbi:ATP-binding protein [Streptomyces sp. DHE7-1]|nr:ATP-binding protein [Streptomyces sp. DHE7-1]
MTEGEPDRALTFLRERLAEGRTGPGRLILVSGGVASGKTRLLDEFLDGAVRDGVRALGATGSADERDLAGGVIDQLLAAPDLPPAAAEEAAHTMAACADTGRRRAAGASGAASPDLTHAVWRLARALLAAARERPTVLVVDDVHLADSASLLLLTHLQRRLRPTLLTMVLALRDTASQGTVPHGPTATPCSPVTRTTTSGSPRSPRGLCATCSTAARATAPRPGSTTWRRAIHSWPAPWPRTASPPVTSVPSRRPAAPSPAPWPPTSTAGTCR